MKIDNKSERDGKLEEDWDFLPTKTIPDPEAKKPEDWDDRPKIDDPEDSKPGVSVWGYRVCVISAGVMIPLSLYRNG